MVEIRAAAQNAGNRDDALLTSMVDSISRATISQSDKQTAIPNLTLYRRDQPIPPTVCLIEPSVVLVVQGEKRMVVRGEAYPYDTERFLITSLDIPANSEVVVASPDRPCYSLGLKLNLRTMAELIAQGGLPAPVERPQERGAGIGLGTVTPELLDAFKRLLDLLDAPDDIAVIAPLIEYEIHYRLLKSDQAARLWQIASVGSQSHRIARAIDWLKVNYKAPLRIEDLAASVRMSTSTLHQHFRQLTAMSPLQYQKWLRLSEARRLMLNMDLDAASAAFEVGYESPSQFSREYARLFGMPPKRDITQLRQQSQIAAVRQSANIL